MENAQKRIAADGESELPEEIIQHIQSLLSERDAARSTLLSKSWHGAWSTRPHLSFNQYAFRYRMDEFPRFTRKFMQRYEDLNPKIKSFKLLMVLVGNNDSLARELILKAIKLGAIDLTVEFSILDASRCFVLPDEVLESETLARLSVCGAMVDFKKRNKVVTSSNLVSLHLSNVTVNGDLIRDLISRCPSIEELTLRKLRSSRHFYLDKMIKLHKLKYLRLEGLEMKDSLSKYDLWHQFPCLKELVIVDYISEYKWDDVRICSPSLERITIVLHQFRSVNAEFDVPNIRYFKFEGHDIPRLKFITIGSREWESDIHIRWSPNTATASWFSSLNQLVKMLSPSRAYLTIFISDLQDDGYGYVGDGLAIPVVENLTIQGVAATRAFLDALLWSCCPNFINIQRRYAEIVDVEVFRQLKMKTRNPRELLHFQRK